MTADLRIGTSGYSFPHWVGTAYPEGTRPADMLKVYAGDFDTVEINFTYYRDPTPEMFEGMLRKVSADFEFVVKAPKGMTHERDAMASVATSFVASLQPLIDAGQLGGVLLQFPQSFHLNDAAFDHLKKVADIFVPHGIKTSIEFRHNEWYEDRVYQLLQKLQLGFVNVDLPRIRALPAPTNILTNDVAYFRLHGRNKEAWYSPPTGSHRYDYLYSDAELEEWAERIEGSLDAAKKACEADVDPTLFASNDPEIRILEMVRRVEASRERTDVETTRLIA